MSTTKTDPGPSLKRLVVGNGRVFTFEAEYCRSADDFRRLYPTLYPDDYRIALLPRYDECWLDYDREDAAFGREVMALVDEIEELAARGYRLPIDTFVIHTSDTIDRDRMYESLKPWYGVTRAR
jgi:hypothetical protein